MLSVTTDNSFDSCLAVLLKHLLQSSVQKYKMCYEMVDDVKYFLLLTASSRLVLNPEHCINVSFDSLFFSKFLGN